MLVPDSLWEGALLDSAAIHSALKLNATPPGIIGRPMKELSHKLFIDSVKYYFQPMLFMAKTRPDEICTPAPFKGPPTYQCKEGQRYTHGAHIFIFNEKFEPVGYHNIHINQPWPFYCNAVVGVGSGDKKKNEALVTVQYFPVDGKAAKKMGDLGSGWRRMTVLLRVTVANGKVGLEQDDRCLGNPNQIESIPDARKKLMKCGM